MEERRNIVGQYLSGLYSERDKNYHFIIETVNYCYIDIQVYK